MIRRGDSEDQEPEKSVTPNSGTLPVADSPIRLRLQFGSQARATIHEPGQENVEIRLLSIALALPQCSMQQKPQLGALEKLAQTAPPWETTPFHDRPELPGSLLFSKREVRDRCAPQGSLWNQYSSGRARKSREYFCFVVVQFHFGTRALLLI